MAAKKKSTAVAVKDKSQNLSAGGRPKGSKNKITLLKLMTEEAVRSRHLDSMLEVCGKIIEDALKGDRDCRKLVWQSIMSKSGSDQTTSSGEAPTIVVKTDRPVELHQHSVIDVTPEVIENG